MADETPKQPAAAEAPAPSPKAPVRPPDAKENFRYIVRLANTDLEGARSVVYALTNVKGLGVRVAEIVADLAGVRRTERIGNLTDPETEKIEEVLGKLADLVPHWMVNRPNDWETGADLHVYSSDIDLRLRDDINRMKMIRCYRGIRHEQGQKVRGQRTRSNGRTGLTVGVIKKTAIAAAKAAEKEEGGKKEKKE
ncbi:MAG: 30S ribosomal protein S13 [Methanobacteriota archaeon]|nr:MAG: 30S ribosomal protein S13 [Euryarchaeota archaeon]